MRQISLTLSLIIGLLFIAPHAGTQSGWSGFFSLPGKAQTAVERPAAAAGPQIEFTAFPCANGIAFVFGIPGYSPSTKTSLSIYDMGGRLLQTLSLGAERSARVEWNLKDRSNRKIGAGIYAARLRTGNLDAGKSFVVF